MNPHRLNAFRIWDRIRLMIRWSKGTPAAESQVGRIVAVVKAAGKRRQQRASPWAGPVAASSARPELQLRERTGGRPCQGEQLTLGWMPALAKVDILR